MPVFLSWSFHCACSGPSATQCENDWWQPGSVHYSKGRDRFEKRYSGNILRQISANKTYSERSAPPRNAVTFFIAFPTPLRRLSVYNSVFLSPHNVNRRINGFPLMFQDLSISASSDTARSAFRRRRRCAHGWTDDVKRQRCPTPKWSNINLSRISFITSARGYEMIKPFDGCQYIPNWGTEEGAMSGMYRAMQHILLYILCPY